MTLCFAPKSTPTTDMFNMHYCIFLTVSRLVWLVVDFDFEGRKKREGGLSASKEIFSGRVRGPDLLQLKNQKQS